MKKHPDHRGCATWGERLVPLEAFAAEVARHGRRLDPDERARERSRLASPVDDGTPVEGPYACVAIFGGVYSNHHALRALLDDAGSRGAEALYCLGDLGGFGPRPEQCWPLLEQGGVRCIQGNYEQSLSADKGDCNCGYTDPRDNHFAAVSYDYTSRHCSAEFKAWMGRLPLRRRVQVGTRELLLVHGSPRRINEFLFHSTTSAAFLERQLELEACDALFCTHTGLPWSRSLPSGRRAVNVGVIGRPANDGDTRVRYCLVRNGSEGLEVESVPLAYDHHALAAEMREEGLPGEFVDTILTGWWTTCLEILPARERALSRY